MKSTDQMADLQQPQQQQPAAAPADTSAAIGHAQPPRRPRPIRRPIVVAPAGGGSAAAAFVSASGSLHYHPAAAQIELLPHGRALTSSAATPLMRPPPQRPAHMPARNHHYHPHHHHHYFSRPMQTSLGATATTGQTSPGPIKQPPASSGASVAAGITSTSTSASTTAAPTSNRYSWATRQAAASVGVAEDEKGRGGHYHFSSSPFASAASRVLVVNPIVNLSEHTKSRLVKFIEAVKHFSEKWFSHVLLLLFLAVYACFGAYIFISFEAPNERDEKQLIRVMRQSILAESYEWMHKNPEKPLKDYQDVFHPRLLDYDRQLRRAYGIQQTHERVRPVAQTSPDTQNTTNMTTSTTTTTAANVTAATDPRKAQDQTGTQEEDDPEMLEAEWTFWGALFYSMTVFTTIGYGHLTPVTFAGRVATMIYAIFGIPILLMVLADLGKLLTRIIKFAFLKFRLCSNKLLKRKSTQRTRQLIQDNTHQYLGVARHAFQRGYTTYIQPYGERVTTLGPFNRLNSVVRRRHQNRRRDADDGDELSPIDCAGNSSATVIAAAASAATPTDENVGVAALESSEVLVTPARQTKPVSPPIELTGGGGKSKSLSSSSSPPPLPLLLQHHESPSGAKATKGGRWQSKSRKISGGRRMERKLSPASTKSVTSRSSSSSTTAALTSSEVAGGARLSNASCEGEEVEGERSGDDEQQQQQQQLDELEVVEEEEEEDFDIPVSFALFLLITYMMLGAVVFSIWEGWNFFDALYFVFISMSTIGFGDLVPQHPKRMIGTFAYLLFGLALTSMCINVVQEKIHATFLRAKMQIGEKMGFDLEQIMADDYYEINSAYGDLADPANELAGPDDGQDELAAATFIAPLDSNSPTTQDTDNTNQNLDSSICDNPRGNKLTHSQLDTQATPGGESKKQAQRKESTRAKKRSSSEGLAAPSGGAAAAAMRRKSSLANRQLQQSSQRLAAGGGGQSAATLAATASGHRNSSRRAVSPKRPSQQQQQQQRKLSPPEPKPIEVNFETIRMSVPMPMPMPMPADAKPTPEGGRGAPGINQPVESVRAFCEPLRRAFQTSRAHANRWTPPPPPPPITSSLSLEEAPDGTRRQRPIQSRSADNHTPTESSRLAAPSLPATVGSSSLHRKNFGQQSARVSASPRHAHSLGASPRRRASVSNELSELDDLILALSRTTPTDRFGPLLGIPSGAAAAAMASVRSSRSNSPARSNSSSGHYSALRAGSMKNESTRPLTSGGGRVTAADIMRAARPSDQNDNNLGDRESHRPTGASFRGGAAAATRRRELNLSESQAALDELEALKRNNNNNSNNKNKSKKSFV